MALSKTMVDPTVYTNKTTGAPVSNSSNDEGTALGGGNPNVNRWPKPGTEPAPPGKNGEGGQPTIGKTPATTGTGTGGTTGTSGLSEKVDPVNIEGTTGQIHGDYTRIAGYQQAAANAAKNTENQAGYNTGEVASEVAGNLGVKKGDDAVSSKSTVQTQLEAILNKDSALMQQAKSGGEVAASKRGQLGSSMGIAGAQSALVSQAADIAKQDASTYAQAGLTAQQAENQQQIIQTEGAVSGELNKQEGAIAERARAIQNTYEAAIKGADQKTAAVLQNNQRKWDKQMKEIDLEFQEWSTKYQIEQGMKEKLQDRRADALMNHQVSMQALLSDPSFLALGKDAIQKLTDTMADGVISTIRYDMLASGYAANDPAMNQYLEDLANDLYLDFSDMEATDE